MLESKRKEKGYKNTKPLPRSDKAKTAVQIRREHNYMSRKDVASEIGVHENTIKHIEWQMHTENQKQKEEVINMKLHEIEIQKDIELLWENIKVHKLNVVAKLEKVDDGKGDEMYIILLESQFKYFQLEYINISGRRLISARTHQATIRDMEEYMTEVKEMNRIVTIINTILT
jgi:DNA-binding XRE family transcriptional regulator